MAEKSPSTNKNQSTNLCEECKKTPSKYKCPGCSIRSCSLTCVNSHKKRTSCNGKRPTTNFVPISQFDDNLLMSDYNMLEDVKRIAESAQRTRIKLCGYSHYNFRLPFPLKNLRRAAASRRTNVLFLANGMSKRDTNKTYYNNRQKSISWTIEWRFHSAGVVLVDHGVNENTTLSSVIENHLKPGPWNHPLKQFCDQTLDSLKFFIRKNAKGPRPLFRQLNMKAPIRQQLANIVLVEYPIIHVFLPSHTYNFEVINDTVPSKVDVKEPTRHDCPSPKGVTFKEEEIEDGESPNPRISYLVNPAHEKRGTEKELVRSPSIVKRVKRSNSVSWMDNTTEDDNGVSGGSCIEQLVAIGDIDFDFGSGLMDVYPDLGVDPDDFLDFDGILAEEKDMEEGGEYFMEEELEEGEIA